MTGASATPWPSGEDLEAELARRAGGPEARDAFRCWRPHRPARPAPRSDNGDEPLTPWSNGAAGLTVPLAQVRRALRWTPTRRQVLAGYSDPDTGEHVEGQIPRAVHELGPAVTVDQVACRLAIHPGDRDFIEALFAPLDARVEEL